jgi:hypothetical protein
MTLEGHRRVFVQEGRALGLKGVRNVFQENGPEGDVLAVRGFKVLSQLVGGEEELRLEAEVGPVAVLGRRLSLWARRRGCRAALDKLVK